MQLFSALLVLFSFYNGSPLWSSPINTQNRQGWEQVNLTMLRHASAPQSSMANL